MERLSKEFLGNAELWRTQLGSPQVGHKGRPRFQFIQFNRCETRYISVGVMDASITEDKCEGINMRGGTGGTKREGLDGFIPPWVSTGSFLLLVPVVELCPARRRGGEGGEERKINPKAAKKPLPTPKKCVKR